jgi:putative thioredoxin
MGLMQDRHWTVDVGDADFEREVIQRSVDIPVIADFWAPWCAPCRTLGPLLDRLATEHRGAFVLAKINVDEAPVIAEVLGIRSIPAVKAFRDGAIVGGFVGAQPEDVVRGLVASILPTESDRLAREGLERMRGGDGGEAERLFREALALEPRHGVALVGLARLLGDRQEIPEALDLLDRVLPSQSVASEAERLAAELRTKKNVTGNVDTLKQQIESDPTDLQARLDLGRLLAAGARYEEALGELLAVVQREPHFADDAGRKAMVDIFAVLGSDHPLTERFRGALAQALYR